MKIVILVILISLLTSCADRKIKDAEIIIDQKMSTSWYPEKKAKYFFFIGGIHYHFFADHKLYEIGDTIKLYYKEK